MSYFDPGDGQFIMVDGNIVERDALRIAEKLKEYDDNLSIMCLDPHRANVNDAPFVICCNRPDGTMYRVFEAWNLDDTILERIYHSDGNRFNPHEKFTSLQEVQKKLREDRYRDRAAENMEIVESAVRNLKSSFSYKDLDSGEKVTIHDDKPSVRGDGRIYHHS